MLDNIKVILVTGVFDVLHPGHCSLIELIHKQYPDGWIIVGVNGDRRANEIKEHVLFSATDRAYMMKSLRYVWDSVIFEDDTPSELIKRIRPNIFVKGPDYIGKYLPEQEACEAVGCQIVFIGTKENNSSDLKRKLHAWS